MKKGAVTKKISTLTTTELEDAREFAELYGKLSTNERQQVKSIIIGIQIAKTACSDSVTI